MNEYEHLLSDAFTGNTNIYTYGELKTLTPQALFFCVMVEETCKSLDVKDIAAVIAVLTGQPILPTRGKFGGATRGTSIASRVCRALLNYDLDRNILPTLTNGSLVSLRFRMVSNLGVFVGRWTPYVGWAVTTYDVIKISLFATLHYNRRAKPEDQINDATTGSLG